MAPGAGDFFFLFLITKRGKRQEEISFEKRNVRVYLGVPRVMPRESLLWKDSHKLRYVFGLNLKKSSIILFIAKFNWAFVFILFLVGGQCISGQKAAMS